ncbi:hypothetical protein ACKWRH_05650 [Bradyrhizobium sp. Pa8]|uniref:hypothetical protein n=1 Tax=Bradyrhizobium sp. Pa8 TaxID=3386552 RepID=UPI00403FB25A
MDERREVHAPEKRDFLTLDSGFVDRHEAALIVVGDNVAFGSFQIKKSAQTPGRKCEGCAYRIGAQFGRKVFIASGELLQAHTSAYDWLWHCQLCRRLTMYSASWPQASSKAACAVASKVSRTVQTPHRIDPGLHEVGQNFGREAVRRTSELVEGSRQAVGNGRIFIARLPET